MTRILVLQGHPDPHERHFGHALADAYAGGASGAGHELRRVDVASLEFPLLRSAQDYHAGALPPVLVDAQAAIGWCEHMVLVFPLWLGGMPAVLKGFLEQVLRPGFASKGKAVGPFEPKALSGRSARIVVTMGMPALAYRWVFRAHSLKALERNILGFVGFSPIDETLIGQVETMSDAERQRWQVRLEQLGAKAR